MHSKSDAGLWNCSNERVTKCCQQLANVPRAVCLSPALVTCPAATWPVQRWPSRHLGVSHFLNEQWLCSSELFSLLCIHFPHHHHQQWTHGVSLFNSILFDRRHPLPLWQYALSLGCSFCLSWEVQVAVQGNDLHYFGQLCVFLLGLLRQRQEQPTARLRHASAWTDVPSTADT